MDRQSVVGILAHVDAGKTTLSEAMLYKSGTIRRLGRVDNGDAFLDTEELEKARGITIFSKQARLNLRYTGTCGFLRRNGTHITGVGLCGVGNQWCRWCAGTY